MKRTLGLGVLLVAVVAATLVAPLGSAQPDGEGQTVDALATEAAHQYETTVAAVQFANSPVIPAVVGGGLGLGIGAIGAAAYAYKNRGMR